MVSVRFLHCKIIVDALLSDLPGINIWLDRVGFLGSWQQVRMYTGGTGGYLSKDVSQHIKRFLFSYLDLPDQLLGIDFKEVWFYSQVGTVKNGWFLCWLCQYFVYRRQGEGSETKLELGEEAALASAGSGRHWSVFVVWTVFFFFLRPHAFMEWLCLCFTLAW